MSLHMSSRHYFSAGKIDECANNTRIAHALVFLAQSSIFPTETWYLIRARLLISFDAHVNTCVYAHVSTHVHGHVYTMPHYESRAAVSSKQALSVANKHGRL